MIDYLNLLNKNQYEAVTATDQYVRIIAGAGSGKTRVLTYRIAYLIEQFHVSPHRILAITFTNKVASEMKERATKLVSGCNVGNLEIMTYHKFCAAFLRREISYIGYPRNYQIFDEEDQKTILKRVAESLNMSRNDKFINIAAKFIANKKGEGLYPEDINPNKIDIRYPDYKQCIEFYKRYESLKTAAFGLDFDDLILKTIQILELHPECQTRWQNYYDYLLIDEFQDTNNIEYKLLKMLLKPSSSLYVVGDPDQTIYTWRGANQKIILDLNESFPKLKTIILDTNYRSTKSILKAANALISHNKYRMEKQLVTANEEGEKVLAKKLFNRISEVKWVIDQIEKLKVSNPDFSYNDVAVLYRATYLSAPFESALTIAKIPYKIFGGIRFYERKEIKDCLAYFRLILTPNDDFSFLRIVNEPKRGLGDTSLTILKNEAQSLNLSLFSYCDELDKHNTQLKSTIQFKLTKLVNIIKDISKRYYENLEAVPEILNDYLEQIDYSNSLLSLDDGEERFENVKSLINEIGDFYKSEDSPSLEIFLQNVTLQTSQDEVDNENCIKLMTIHTAKGLEYPYVFVVGLIQGVSPSQRTLDENPIMGLEEERRLIYVAFTRAKKRLFVTCNSDYSYASRGNSIPSIFFKEAKLEFNNDFVQTNENRKNVRTPDVDPRLSIFSQIKKSSPNDIIWKVGDCVNHKSFGIGVVEEIHGDIIVVVFKDVGRKSLIGNHPFLSKIENNLGEA